MPSTPFSKYLPMYTACIYYMLSLPQCGMCTDVCTYMYVHVHVKSCVFTNWVVPFLLQEMNDEEIVETVDFSEFEALFQVKRFKKQKKKRNAG